VSKLTCEWLAGCDQDGDLYEYTNAFDQKVRFRYCRTHAAAMRNPEQREELLKRLQVTIDATAGRLGKQVDYRLLAQHPAQLALTAHQEECWKCRGVREWIAREQMSGRIRTPTDIDRVGHHVIDNCCEAGVELNRLVGMVLAGLE
jgi:hypothetical protein